MTNVVKFRRRDNRDRLLLDIDDHQGECRVRRHGQILMERPMKDLSVPELASCLLIKIDEFQKRRRN